MISYYLILALSILVNVGLVWYLIKILRKFIFISDNLADLFLITKAFQVFVKSMYSMDSFYGEPMIQELVIRIREVSEEIERFRDIFEHSLDTEIEEELDATDQNETT